MVKRDGVDEIYNYVQRKKKRGGGINWIGGQKKRDTFKPTKRYDELDQDNDVDSKDVYKQFVHFHSIQIQVGFDSYVPEDHNSTTVHASLA